MKKQVNGIKIRTVGSEWNVYFNMALTMLDEIVKNNREGKKTVMIVPVGPTDHYPILAELINHLDVSLKNVWFFNMDEYLITPDRYLDFNDKMSFHNRMNTEFYERIREDLIMPEKQRRFPCPGREREYDGLLNILKNPQGYLSCAMLFATLFESFI